MIKKFKQYNESIKSLLVGPSDEEVLNNFKRKYDKGEIDIFSFYVKCKELNLKNGITYEEMWLELINNKFNGLLNHVPESPEDFFNQMREGCVEIQRVPHSIFYGKNDVILFQHILKNKEIYISNKYIWSILQKIYKLSYDEIQSLIKKSLKNDTKFKGLTPYYGSEWFA